MASDPAVAAASVIGDANGPTVGQLLVRWSLRRGMAAVVSTSKPTRATELLDAPFVQVEDSALDVLDTVPRDRHRRRVAPPPFAFLFDE